MACFKLRIVPEPFDGGDPWGHFPRCRHRRTTGGDQATRQREKFQVEDLGLPARTERCHHATSRSFQSCQHFIEGCFLFVVEDAAGERPTVPPARGQEIKQVAGRQHGAAGGVKIAVNRGKEQPSDTHLKPGV